MMWYELCLKVSFGNVSNIFMVKSSQTHPKPLIKLAWHSILLGLIHTAEISVDKEKRRILVVPRPLGLMRSKLVSDAYFPKILDAVLVLNLPQLWSHCIFRVFLILVHTFWFPTFRHICGITLSICCCLMALENHKAWLVSQEGSQEPALLFWPHLRKKLASNRGLLLIGMKGRMEEFLNNSSFGSEQQLISWSI